jgi:hypothetical protein
MTVEAGQWTRLHILNVGHQYNSILTIESVAAGAAQCDVGLLSKVRVCLYLCSHTHVKQSKVQAVVRCSDASVALSNKQRICRCA